MAIQWARTTTSIPHNIDTNSCGITRLVHEAPGSIPAPFLFGWTSGTWGTSRGKLGSNLQSIISRQDLPNLCYNRNPLLFVLLQKGSNVVQSSAQTQKKQAAFSWFVRAGAMFRQKTKPRGGVEKNYERRRVIYS